MMCRRCERTVFQIGGYLVRVNNEKGVPGIWECRPSCEVSSQSSKKEESVTGLKVFNIDTVRTSDPAPKCLHLEFGKKYLLNGEIVHYHGFGGYSRATLYFRDAKGETLNLQYLFAADIKTYPGEVYEYGAATGGA